MFHVITSWEIYYAVVVEAIQKPTVCGTTNVTYCRKDARSVAILLRIASVHQVALYVLHLE